MIGRGEVLEKLFREKRNSNDGLIKGRGKKRSVLPKDEKLKQGGVQ